MLVDCFPLLLNDSEISPHQWCKVNTADAILPVRQILTSPLLLNLFLRRNLQLRREGLREDFEKRLD